jgi:hypothetical protein
MERHLEEQRRLESPKKNVHFKDEFEGGDLCDVVVIESYKKYYIGNEAKCSCTCQIF